MDLSFIILSAYNNGWSSPRNHYYEPVDPLTTLLWLFILIGGLFLLLTMSTVNWDKVKFDIKNYFIKKILGKNELISKDIPLGIKYILLNMGIKSRHIEKVYKLNRKYLKKMDTYFSYEIVTSHEKFHIYFDEVDGENSWFIYSNGKFDNKPIRVKDNYYDIIEVINNGLFNNIKNNFHKRLEEQTFLKV